MFLEQSNNERNDKAFSSPRSIGRRCGGYGDDLRRGSASAASARGWCHSFARNFETRKQLVALTKRIHDLRSPALLIAVDHEGGRVQRFRTDGFTTLPSMRSLGLEWLKDPMRAMRMATDVGYVLGAELRACGVDLSFTPVLDLDFGVSSVIGDRALSPTAHREAETAKAHRG